ncbi:hypothetical protein M9458_029342, partial [Cirrhinus mrigala]
MRMGQSWCFRAIISGRCLMAVRAGRSCHWLLKRLPSPHSTGNSTSLKVGWTSDSFPNM